MGTDTKSNFFLELAGYFQTQADKLIVSVRTAQANEYTLDKKATSYNDSLGALRLSLKGYQIE